MHGPYYTAILRCTDHIIQPYYDARTVLYSHTTMHGPQNIKFKICPETLNSIKFGLYTWRCRWVFYVCIFATRFVLFYCVCIAVLHASCRIDSSQYPEGPATGHLGTGFACFPSVEKRMPRWFLRLQVATACFSCSPPDLNFLVTYFTFM
jgi:hypothetical protein